MLFVLDSLGMLSTTKEMEDTASGKETRDMTRSQIVKSTFRVLTLKLGQANVPMIIPITPMMLLVLCFHKKKWAVVLD